MVDRPIKKSDREAAQQSQPADAGAGDAPTPQASKVPPPVKKADRKDGGPASSDSRDSRDDRDDRGRGGKGRGKGRGRGKDDAPKGPMNPALMRGPKPTKKVEAPEEPEEVTAEAGSEGEEAAETATPDATPESAEATPEATTEEAAPTADATAE